MAEDAGDELTEAFATARDLIADAGSEADRIRAEAERYARQREQEADLLIAKARRVLGVAEDKAAAIIATARVQAPALVEGGEVDTSAIPQDTASRPLELSEPAYRKVVAPGATTLRHGVEARAAGEPNRFDRVLAQAIAHAVETAFQE